MPLQVEKECKNLGGWKLRQVRKLSKLDQVKFAIAYRYSPSTVSLWETGRSIPNIPNGVRLEDEFGILIRDWLEPAPKAKAA